MEQQEHQQQWVAIREHSRAGQSVSAIARDLDRKTVRTALRRTAWQPYTRRKPPGMLAPHMAWLRERAPQVGCLARTLHWALRDLRGITGCHELVKAAVPAARRGVGGQP